MTEKYTGPERRSDVCAFHDMGVKEIRRTQENIKSKVPIWVFLLIVTAAITAMSWLNYEITKKSEHTQAELSRHVAEANRLSKRLITGFNTIAWNQRRVMSAIKLEFQEFPTIVEPE